MISQPYWKMSNSGRSSCRTPKRRGQSKTVSTTMQWCEHVASSQARSYTLVHTHTYMPAHAQHAAWLIHAGIHMPVHAHARLGGPMDAYTRLGDCKKRIGEQQHLCTQPWLNLLLPVGNPPAELGLNSILLGTPSERLLRQREKRKPDKQGNHKRGPKGNGSVQCRHKGPLRPAR